MKPIVEINKEYIGNKVAEAIPEVIANTITSVLRKQFSDGRHYGETRGDGYQLISEVVEEYIYSEEFKHAVRDVLRTHGTALIEDSILRLGQSKTRKLLVSSHSADLEV